MSSSQLPDGGELPERRENESPLQRRERAFAMGRTERGELSESVRYFLDPNQEPLKGLLEKKEELAQASRTKIQEFWGNTDHFASELQKIINIGDLNTAERLVTAVYTLQLVAGFQTDLGECDGKYGPRTHEAFLRLLEHTGRRQETGGTQQRRISELSVSGDRRFNRLISNESEVTRRANFSRDFILSDETGWDVPSFRNAYKNAAGRDLNFYNDAECFAGIYNLQKLLGFAGRELDGMYGKKTHKAFVDMLRENGIDTPFRRMPRGQRG